MIHKNGDYKNGYIFTKTSTDEEFQKIIKRYDKVRCVICNKNTVRNFRNPYYSNVGITINNKLADGVFFINGVY